MAIRKSFGIQQLKGFSHGLGLVWVAFPTGYEFDSDGKSLVKLYARAEHGVGFPYIA